MSPHCLLKLNCDYSLDIFTDLLILIGLSFNSAWQIEFSNATAVSSRRNPTKQSFLFISFQFLEYRAEDWRDINEDTGVPACPIRSSACAHWHLRGFYFTVITTVSSSLAVLFSELLCLVPLGRLQSFPLPFEDRQIGCFIFTFVKYFHIAVYIRCSTTCIIAH